MTSFDDFRIKNQPAFGESEHDYFTRLSVEYKKMQKRKARQVRSQRWVSILSGVTRGLIIEPNLLRNKSA